MFGMTTSFQAPSAFGPNHADRPRPAFGGFGSVGGFGGFGSFGGLHGQLQADARAKKDFKAIDKDRDGTISKEEFKALHQDAAKAEKLYAQLDLDGDGRVTGREYRKVREAEARIEDMYRRFTPEQRKGFLEDRLHDLKIDW